MKPVLIESMLFPPIPAIGAIVKHSAFIFEACENYQKRSFRNRFYIAGPNGIELCSIPLLKGKHQKQLIKDVQIAYYEDWHVGLLRQIQACYGSAPYFDFLFPELEHLFTRKYDLLFDLNLKSMELIGQYIDPIQYQGVSKQFRAIIDTSTNLISESFKLQVRGLNALNFMIFLPIELYDLT